MKNLLLSLAIIGLSSAASAQTIRPTTSGGGIAGDKWFSDLYAEGIYLGDSDNAIGFGHLRVGKAMSPFEVYGAVRSSTDTKSSTSALGQVYNDNFIFTGVGLDYVPSFVTGFRLRGQIGVSYNLLDRPTQREGFDYQLGLVSYHEGKFGGSDLSFENYGEAFYIHRYENLLINNQFRVLYNRIETQSGATTFGAYPIAMGVVNFDTSDIFYNRFVDLRVGVRLQARSTNWMFYLTPMYVTGKYIVNSTQSFDEFRVLAVLYTQFF